MNKNVFLSVLFVIVIGSIEYNREDNEVAVWVLKDNILACMAIKLSSKYCLSACSCFNISYEKLVRLYDGLEVYEKHKRYKIVDINRHESCKESKYNETKTVGLHDIAAVKIDGNFVGKLAIMNLFQAKVGLFIVIGLHFNNSKLVSIESPFENSSEICYRNFCGSSQIKDCTSLTTFWAKNGLLCGTASIEPREVPAEIDRLLNENDLIGMAVLGGPVIANRRVLGFANDLISSYVLWTTFNDDENQAFLSRLFHEESFHDKNSAPKIIQYLILIYMVLAFFNILELLVK